jgi:hypothetical protein
MEWMPSWLDRLFGGSEARPPLRGAPAVRRQKNYTALSGYAYEYFFDGYRDCPGERRYEFTVSGDRKNWFPLVVVLPESALSAWEESHGRRLADNERYGVAKLALFAAFDERPGPNAMRESPVRVTPELAAEIFVQLGFE